ncbi:hypothetical protein BU14_0325s0010 [Porphyra umbilicalis]|uniref:Uncharacterized protein n=1 Tax=Porphyra umbilicalis TaxID=2786 RepID=A0A1X6NYX7_PORUM|nr:hypothetical protein BU14_0325s0010 [Porphyra umbilicalis]|eukprot:OSX73831.1 hypothetical protein BU14_0325s0010 [Porphyra umbilicalis]
MAAAPPRRTTCTRCLGYPRTRTRWPSSAPTAVVRWKTTPTCPRRLTPRSASWPSKPPTRRCRTRPSGRSMTAAARVAGRAAARGTTGRREWLVPPAERLAAAQTGVSSRTTTGGGGGRPIRPWATWMTHGGRSSATSFRASRARCQEASAPAQAPVRGSSTILWNFSSALSTALTVARRARRRQGRRAVAAAARPAPLQRCGRVPPPAARRPPVATRTTCSRRSSRRATQTCSRPSWTTPASSCRNSARVPSSSAPPPPTRTAACGAHGRRRRWRGMAPRRPPARQPRLPSRPACARAWQTWTRTLRGRRCGSASWPTRCRRASWRPSRTPSRHAPRRWTTNWNGCARSWVCEVLLGPEGRRGARWGGGHGGEAAWRSWESGGHRDGELQHGARTRTNYTETGEYAMNVVAG